MKKTLITSFLTMMILGIPVLAAETAPIATVKSETTVETKEVKVETLKEKNDKIEKDLRTTVSKLKSVADRIQILIDLLNKNNRDTTDALKYLNSAKSSLQVAISAIDQFSGILPEVKTEVKTDLKPETKSEATLKKEVVTPVVFKEPLKKTEDSLKESKALLTQSITALKESITIKDSN